jgi:hypothetical protein
LLNEERAKVGEPPARHDNVLRATRTAREKLGAVSLLNFEERKYMDIRGKMSRGNGVLGRTFPRILAVRQ